MKALVYRLQRKPDQARKAVTRGLALDPLEPALKAEAERLNLAPRGQQPDPMETAQFYMELGDLAGCISGAREDRSTHVAAEISPWILLPSGSGTGPDSAPLLPRP